MRQTVLFEKHAAILLPSLFQHTSKMPPLPLYVFKILPSLTDHMCRHWSREPLAKYSPPGLNATEYTGCLQSRISWVQPLQPTKRKNSIRYFYKSTHLSLDLILKICLVFWKGVYFSPGIKYLWPAKLYRRRPCSTSHSLIVESKEALHMKQNSQSLPKTSAGKGEATRIPKKQESYSR